ncbi:hypothetical protein [Parvularcula mediterranea]|nr:hypothetical protein [Parvularcula mediterranea]
MSTTPEQPDPRDDAAPETLTYGGGEAEAEPREALPAQEKSARGRALRMMGWTIGVLVLVVVLAVLFVPAQFLEMRLSVLLKLGAGVLATIVLAAGLMATAFYSDASGHDDDAPGV